MRRALTAAAALACVIAAGCGGGSSKENAALTATGPTPAATTGVSTSQATPRRVKYRYPRVLQRSFLVSCVKNGGSAAACACTLHRLQERMPLAQFIDYGSALQAKRKPPAALERKFRRTAMECARTSS